jgi:predicted extracellular nuclease
VISSFSQKGHLMAVRIATFNVENLMQRFDFSGFQHHFKMDRTLSLFEITSDTHFQQLEQARIIASTDDTRQLTALAIADTFADIICLQEVDNIEILNAFEFGYLFKMIGAGYTQKFLIEGNDSRGIDVAVMMREKTFDGDPIVFETLTSHAHLTFADLNLFNDDLLKLGILPTDKIFRRDCLELNVIIGGKPLTIFVTHFKAMGGARDGVDGRILTMPVRKAEAKAIKHIIEKKFGTKSAQHNWLICGDLNDYQQRVQVIGGGVTGYEFKPVTEEESALNFLLENGFCENLVARRDPLDQWTHYHSRGPLDRHLCQLDYLLASPALSQLNTGVVPDIIRKGQPFRTIFPVGQNADRYPRVGWDRPKASDHCPVAMTFKL